MFGMGKSGAWQLTCSATIVCWVWSGRGANVPHELGIKFRHKMQKSAPDFTVFPRVRAHMQHTPTLITSQFGKLREADAENMRRVRKSADRDTVWRNTRVVVCLTFKKRSCWETKMFWRVSCKDTGQHLQQLSTQERSSSSSSCSAARREPSGEIQDWLCVLLLCKGRTPLKVPSTKKLIKARLGVSRTIYVNVDTPNQGFTFFNFLGGTSEKNTLYHKIYIWKENILSNYVFFTCRQNQTQWGRSLGQILLKSPCPVVQKNIYWEPNLEERFQNCYLLKSYIFIHC